jgi:hypothetical protein
MNMAQVVKVSDLFPKIEIVQDSQTLSEICTEAGLGETKARGLIKALLEEGRVRRVYKKIDGRLVKAYATNSKK